MCANDPRIQSAMRVQDIILHHEHDKAFQREVAVAIHSLKGKGVCFLLDGLDEASPSLLKFLLQDLLVGKSGCPKLSFIIHQDLIHMLQSDWNQFLNHALS